MLSGLLNGNDEVEKRIVNLMAADYSWEQVIYDLVAAEGMDPWNLDLNVLSQSFLSYMKKIQELDFRIPAKYVIISSVILRMKSDTMRLLDIPSANGEVEMDSEYLDGQPAAAPINFNMGFFNLQERRRPTKQVMVTDLITSLKKLLTTNERKDMKMEAARNTIKISADSIVDRINNVYKKINSMLVGVNKEEVPFSTIVEKWQRKDVVEHFLPLVYLDNEKKIACRQENFFDEIYIKKSDRHLEQQPQQQEPTKLADEMKTNMNMENKISEQKKSRKVLSSGKTKKLLNPKQSKLKSKPKLKTKTKSK